MLRPIINFKDLEQSIVDYDYLGKQITALKDQRETLKDSLVLSYFNDQPEYRDCNGILLATYKEVSREYVKGSSLKLALPDVYEKYMYVTKFHELRVK